jgi:phosphopantothenoylcysteine decarboxylase/phosphopantothenate--cysteine ligase
MKTESLRFLITAGPTREFFDPIRFLSNRSSGKMGYAVAEAARKISPNVVLVSGPVCLAPPNGVEVVRVITAQEMADAVFARYANADVVMMAAAICDFRARVIASSKIKKGNFSGRLDLEPTIDILAELGRRKTSQLLVGFAAETDDLQRHALEKLRRKQLDLIVANDASAFESDTSAVTIISAESVEQLPQKSKREVAEEILNRVTKLVD